MKRAYEIFWILDYLDDIRADFFAIYHIMDWESLDGPLFISLTERLPLYAGALQARIKLENEKDSTDDYDSSTDYQPGQSIPMTQALSGDTKLMALNTESQNAGGGTLFQFETG
jgi:hypothetical protein